MRKERGKKREKREKRKKRKKRKKRGVKVFWGNGWRGQEQGGLRSVVRGTV